MRKIHIYNTNRFVIISDEDYEWASQHRWTMHPKGYAKRTIPNSGNKKTLMHREIMERKIGRTLSHDEYVDHKNERPLCNLRSNLRILNNSANLHNTTAKGVNNTSGYKGVSRHINGKWRARLTAHGHEHCSYHDTRAEASKAYKAMLKQYYPAL